MASLDQLQSCLTLTDAALAHDQDTFAVYIYQHAVDRDTRSQLYIQPADDLRHKRRCIFLCGKDRNTVLCGDTQDIFIRIRF